MNLKHSYQLHPFQYTKYIKLLSIPLPRTETGNKYVFVNLNQKCEYKP